MPFVRSRRSSYEATFLFAPMASSPVLWIIPDTTCLQEVLGEGCQLLEAGEFISFGFIHRL